MTFQEQKCVTDQAKHFWDTLEIHLKSPNITIRENHEFAPNLDDIASKFLRLILFEFASKSYQIRS